MINKFRSLVNGQAVLTLFLVFFSSVVTLLSTKLVFIKFQEEGLLGLSTAVNIAGIAGILCSLSIESGLIRKIVITTTAKKSFTSLTLAVLLLYPFGVTAGLIYFIFSEASVTVSVIFALLLYLPFSVLRSYLIAEGLQKFSSLLTLILTAGLLFSVIISTHPNELLNNMMLSQAILMCISIFIFYFIIRAPLKKIQINKNSFNKKDILINALTSFELLRFSMHSVASGLQSNQALLISRVFLITFAGTAFAGQMEMYQRPLIWMLSFGSQISGLFFYPFVVKQMELNLSSSDDQLIIDRKVFIYTGFYTLGFLGLLCFTFPILFRVTFGAEVSISLLYSIFWISIFGSRFLAVLFSSWLLAKNNVKSAMVGEAVLYMPSIIFFGLIPIFFNNNAYDMTNIYFAIIGLSSLIQMIYFLYKLKFYATFKLKQ